ncbi:MAG: hypothetical protein K6B65_00980 [Bacilli bacterium]|nr:hypothetical protein [Bacilli bacterium]
MYNYLNHDSCMKEVYAHNGGTPSLPANAVTQGHTILSQLEDLGIRKFDVRLDYLHPISNGASFAADGSDLYACHGKTR